MSRCPTISSFHPRLFVLFERWDTCVCAEDPAILSSQALVLNNGSSLLYSADQDGHIRCWRTSDLRTMGHFEGHSMAVRGTTPALQGSALHAIHLCAEAAQTVRSAQVWALALSPDGAALFSSSDDRTIRCWRTSDHTCTHVLQVRAAGGAAQIPRWRPHALAARVTLDLTPLPTTCGRDTTSRWFRSRSLRTAALSSPEASTTRSAAGGAENQHSSAAAALRHRMARRRRAPREAFAGAPPSGQIALAICNRRSLCCLAGWVSPLSGTGASTRASLSGSGTASGSS